MGLTCLYLVPKIVRFGEMIAQKLPPSLETLHLLFCDITCTVHLQALGIACAAGSYPCCLRQVYIEMRGFIPPSGREIFQIIFDMFKKRGIEFSYGIRGPMKRLQSDNRHFMESGVEL